MARRVQTHRPEMMRSSKTRVIHLGLAGEMIEALRNLLADVITDIGVRWARVSQPGACDVVLVMVSWGDELRAVEGARALAGDVPLLAILPFADDELAMYALLAGAQAWFALDTPLALLRASLLELADLGSPANNEAA